MLLSLKKMCHLNYKKKKNVLSPKLDLNTFNNAEQEFPIHLFIEMYKHFLLQCSNRKKVDARH